MIYLNCFFYNASEEFQEAFSSEDVTLPINFYDFLTTNIILATNLNENKKIYDLDFLEEDQVEPRVIGRKESLAFSTGRFAIKFIQNLCEGHNREYQKKFFFNFEFDKEEYLYNNENIYNKKINTSLGFYGKFVRLSKTNIYQRLEKEAEERKTDNNQIKKANTKPTSIKDILLKNIEEKKCQKRKQRKNNI